MAGVLGVGEDITKWNNEQKSIARNKITQYKEIREIVQGGNAYRIISPYNENRSVLQYTSRDKKESVIFYYQLSEYPKNVIPETQRTTLVKLKGLLPSTKYRIEEIDHVYTGEYLMSVGITFPLRGTYKSQIYKLRSID
jgi:alpha-galactosidase